MQKDTQNETPNRNNICQAGRILGIIVCVVGILGLGFWVMWMFGAAEHFAVCNESFTVWRRNPGAFSSYRYEIRNGLTVVETGLSYNLVKDFLDEHQCTLTIPGGG